MNKSQIYINLLIANVHAQQMKMNSVDAVYPDEFSEEELEELTEFLKSKFKESGSEFTAINYVGDKVRVIMVPLAVTVYTK